jgi:serine/threonine protein kinase
LRIAEAEDALTDFPENSTSALAGTIGRFRLVERIGSGGFASVFKALDPESDRVVAVKTCTLGEEAHARFFREARLAGALRHPNITKVYESGMDGDTPFIVQELLGGRDLSALIADRQPHSLDAKRRILMGVADGLEYAHGQGVVHRDIKPSNVRVLDDGTIKIMDFGIAKSVDTSTAVTKSGVAVGSMGYMSPEQVIGDSVDPRTDLFLLGVLAYELLAFQPPFRHDNLFRLMEMIVKEDPDPLIDVAPTVPPGMVAVVEKAMRKRPNDRFSTAAQMRDALERGEP